MQDHFNLAALAKLSKNELETLLATLIGQFHAASTDLDRSALQSQIATVRLSLKLK